MDRLHPRRLEDVGNPWVQDRETGPDPFGLDCIHVPRSEFTKHRDLHRVPALSIVKYNTMYAWVLRGARPRKSHHVHLHGHHTHTHTHTHNLSMQLSLDYGADFRVMSFVMPLHAAMRILYCCQMVELESRSLPRTSLPKAKFDFPCDNTDADSREAQQRWKHS